jgi:hypothetical protein
LRVLAEQRAVGEDDELALVAAEPGRIGRGDGVPAPGAGDAVDPDLAPERPRIEIGRRLVEPSTLRELDVQGLTAEQAQRSISSVSTGAAPSLFAGVL